jgi:acyl-CoA dehydrogenase family protein 9
MTATAGNGSDAGVGPVRTLRGGPSFVESLFCGCLRSDLVLPFPALAEDESRRVDRLVETLLDYAREAVDPVRMESDRWIGDDVVQGLAERGLMGLGVPEPYGGQGLSSTGYCRVFEALGALDPTFAVVLGIHQSIGTRGIVLFGTDEQKDRFLPDLAAARRLAAFALTEPFAGSDAYALRSRAVREPDGAWRLNGEKRYIGNGEKGDVFVTFARGDVGGRTRHVALILEKGMPGFEHGERYDMLGLRANDVRRLRFNDVRVPPENVLGEPGDGYRMAMKILETGRLTLAAGDVGVAKRLTDRIALHVQEREQFGRPLAGFALVQEKLAWLVSNIYAMGAMAYLTTGLADAGGVDTTLETAVCKVNSSEFAVGAANRCFDLRGGEAFMRTEPYEKIMRDVRIFPVFEGSNDVLRAFIALNGIKALVARLQSPDGGPPPERPDGVHPDLAPALDALGAQAERLGERTKGLLMTHLKAVRERQLDQRRLADAAAAVYTQAAAVARAAAAPDGEAGDRERLIARAYCAEASAAVDASLGALDRNADEHVAPLAELALAGTAFDADLRAIDQPAFASAGSSPAAY